MEALIADCLTDDVKRRPSMQEVVERLVALDAPADSTMEDSAHESSGPGSGSTQTSTS